MMMRMRSLLPLSIALIMVPAIAPADALTDLRAALVQLKATTPVHGSLDIASTTKSTEEEKPEVGKATIAFESADAGLRILYPRPVLIQADQEARSEASDADRATPTRNALRRVQPLHVADLLDGATAMNVTLQNAHVVDAKPATWRGRPSRLVVLKITPKVSKSSAKHVKKLESTLSVWLGDDGIPVAAEQTILAKASFLLLSFANDQKQSWTYVRTGNRLVVIHYEQTQKTDGLGQHQSSQTTQVLRLE